VLTFFQVISLGFAFGLCAVSSLIGQQALHQIDHQGSAKVPFYLGFDLAFALANFPNTELVFRVQHRSGAASDVCSFLKGLNRSRDRVLCAGG
jgi:hypothetical protein